jgi:O-antigen/teichoic acid export membrane protein
LTEPGDNEPLPGPPLIRKVAMNAAALTAGRIAVLAGGVVAVGLASRYLGVSDYGAFTVAVVFVSLFVGLTDFGVSTVAAREMAREPENEHRIICNAFTMGIAIAAVVSAVAYALMWAVYAGADDREVREGITILLVQLLAACPVATCRAFWIARQRAFMSAFGDIASTFTALTLMGFAVALDLGLQGIVWAQAIGYCANALLMLALSARRMRLRFAIDLGWWRRLIRLSAPLGGTQVVNDLYFRLDTILLSFFRSQADVGLYGLAYRIVEGLILLPSYIMITLVPEIARLEPSSPRLRQIVTEAYSAMQIFALPVAIVFVIFAPEVVTIVGGSEFSDAAPALRILVLGVAVSYLNAVFGYVLVGLGRQSLLFRLSLAVLAANVALNLILIPLIGVEGAATAVTGSEIVSLILLRRMYARIAPPPRNPRFRRVALAASAMGVSALVKVALDAMGAQGLLVLCIGALAGFVAYAAALFALRALPGSLSPGELLRKVTLRK